MITTSDNVVAQRLVTDPRSDMVSFTGSTAVGRRLMASAADGLKRVFLELGGKSAHVVLEDAISSGVSLSLRWRHAVMAARAARR